MSKKVLVISTSLRTKGNSAALAAARLPSTATERQRLNDEDLGANLIYMAVEYGKTTKELAAITGMTQGQVTYAMKKYRF